MTRSIDDSNHWPQLDGLRALAVLGVLVEHYFAGSHVTHNLGISWGEVGVQCFFVLSGFLITGILLRCRTYHETGKVSNTLLLRQFYARRFLRIFPLFYMTILVCWSLNIGRMRETWPWHVSYLSNVGIVVGDGGGFGHSFHFWTLAVEEQFYVVWPLLILFLPKRLLPTLILGCILVAPLFRFVMAVAPVPWLARYLLTPACLDSLAAGALLAWLRQAPGWEPAADRVCRIGLILGCVVQGVLISRFLPPSVESAVSTVVGRLAWSAIFTFVVAAACNGIPGFVGRSLTIGPMIYLGRISYGIYVLHHFAIDILDLCIPAAYFERPAGIELRFLVLTTMTIGAASISWFFLERPLNALKSHFPYRGIRGVNPTA